ncbi:MAG: tRNA pseudouridine(54/55) synthase Pus10 [Nitrososphaerota archaeon]|nr:tRNA pseudouridine(54/55) synthase Pus10 [Candidatus Bathyarchaeota archaeon]MDW8023807.1 tRNA pseudouridine(54/55) synthase Pus10 [Nitrososphaerota archaeon]
MSILEQALEMLEKHPLCDYCLGRQFALLLHGVENKERGEVIKTALAMEAQALAVSNKNEGMRILKILATNGFSKKAEEILLKMRKRASRKKYPKTCFLCENQFELIDELAKNAVKKLAEYEFRNFLVGIDLPFEVEEREDEFKARFNVKYGESIRLEFGRLLGKKISHYTGKALEYAKPEIVVLINPTTGEMRLQANPLFIAGRYKKLVRSIPQSRWFCSKCRGKGCGECNWTGKRYLESVEELISKPVLEATGGVETSFHASGREDIDVLMLGRGRPFVIEVSEPRKRFLDLKKLEETINASAKGKVEVSELRFVDKDFVRKLKKAEFAQKEYHVVVEFEKDVSDEDIKLLREKLANATIKQRTPTRVLHRRTDLTREKYIYEVKIKRLSPRTVEMRILCQGGLYVKELVTGDDGRTTPSVSEILGIKAKPIKLDVLNVIMED